MYHLTPNTDPLVDIEYIRLLVEQAQTGNPDAFGEIYGRYYATVYRTIYRRVSNHTLTEDLTSEVFTRALRGIGRFQWQGHDPGEWLTTIALNLVANHYKSSRHRLEVTTGELRIAQRTPARTLEGNPETAAINHLTNAAVLAAVNKLKPDQRRCVTLRFLHGLPFADIARIMDKSEGTVRGIQYRAMRALARLFKGSAP